MGVFYLIVSKIISFFLQFFKKTSAFFRAFFSITVLLTVLYWYDVHTHSQLDGKRNLSSCTSECSIYSLYNLYNQSHALYAFVCISILFTIGSFLFDFYKIFYDIFIKIKLAFSVKFFFCI